MGVGGLHHHDERRAARRSRSGIRHPPAASGQSGRALFTAVTKGSNAMSVARRRPQ
jgi:hypothetical protein